MTSSIPQFVGKLQKAPETLKQGQTAAVKQAAMAAKTAFLHAPGKPSKVARKTVGVNFRMFGTDSALVRYTGPAHLVNNPTKPHQIAPKRRKAVRLRDGSLRSVIEHPGTTGKHFYEKAKPVAAKAATAAYTSETRQQLRKVFGG